MKTGQKILYLVAATSLLCLLAFRLNVVPVADEPLLVSVRILSVISVGMAAFLGFGGTPSSGKIHNSMRKERMKSRERILGLLSGAFCLFISGIVIFSVADFPVDQQNPFSAILIKATIALTFCGGCALIVSGLFCPEYLRPLFPPHHHRE